MLKVGRKIVEKKCSFPVVIVYFFLNYLQTCFENFGLGATPQT